MTKVTTLDDAAFGEACASLQRIVDESGFRPDIVVGIRSGGAYVSEKMWPDLPHAEVTSRRPSTDTKRGLSGTLLRGALRLMPRRLRDSLRIFEASRLEKRYEEGRRQGEIERKVAARCVRIVWPDLFDKLPSGDVWLPPGSRVMIIDDAVDSGVTLEAVETSLRKLRPDLQIRSAVLTVTFTSPIIRPDFILYNDRRLIRFPWPIDS